MRKIYEVIFARALSSLAAKLTLQKGIYFAPQFHSMLSLWK